VARGEIVFSDSGYRPRQLTLCSGTDLTERNQNVLVGQLTSKIARCNSFVAVGNLLTGSDEFGGREDPI
jgi:hypothetical protein